MAERSIRVLVVDDSGVMRRMIADALASAAGIEVVGSAACGREALTLFERHRPDVITLDMQMPGMDGLATLDALLARRPVAVVMVTALTQFGAAVTLEAIQRGALDYVAKPASGSEAARVLQEELVRKIRWVARADVPRILALRRKRLSSRGQAPEDEPTSDQLHRMAACCILIGVSTGGPPAVVELFGALSPPMPPMAVVQHMPPGFTRPFA
ncbi:MAG TPA: response regulator, partial [Planctomycetaceae bacterium]|nr:response regulator [Planctomycetaceae bacterium]